jgi:catechol 2,3-dioxygenase-like lactoylglutathione lyase family enzyme
MLLKHVGLTCSTEDNADKFYRDLLGLNKSEAKILSADLSNAIFNIDRQLQIINYMNENLQFEIFITGQRRKGFESIDHQCLAVDDLSIFIEKCRKMGVALSQIPKGDKTLTFIKDFDGNLFEIKGG